MTPLEIFGAIVLLFISVGALFCAGIMASDLLDRLK